MGNDWAFKRILGAAEVEFAAENDISGVVSSGAHRPALSLVRARSSQRMAGCSAGVLPRWQACARNTRRRSEQEVVMEDLQVAAMSAQLAERIGRRRFDLWFKSEAQLSVEASCLAIRAAS